MKRRSSIRLSTGPSIREGEGGVEEGCSAGCILPSNNDDTTESSLLVQINVYAKVDTRSTK